MYYFKEVQVFLFQWNMQQVQPDTVGKTSKSGKGPSDPGSCSSSAVECCVNHFSLLSISLIFSIVKTTVAEQDQGFPNCQKTIIRGS